jgi:hypothetical protein
LVVVTSAAVSVPQVSMQLLDSMQRRLRTYWPQSQLPKPIAVLENALAYPLLSAPVLDKPLSEVAQTSPVVVPCMLVAVQSVLEAALWSLVALPLTLAGPWNPEWVVLSILRGLWHGLP